MSVEAVRSGKSTDEIRNQYSNAHVNQNYVDINDPSIGNALAGKDSNNIDALAEKGIESLFSKIKSMVSGILEGKLGQLKNTNNTNKGTAAATAHDAENKIAAVQNQQLSIAANADLSTCDSTLDQANQIITDLKSQTDVIESYLNGEDISTASKNKEEINSNNTKIEENNAEIKELGGEEVGEATDISTPPSGNQNSGETSGGDSGGNSSEFSFSSFTKGLGQIGGTVSSGFEFANSLIGFGTSGDPMSLIGAGKQGLSLFKSINSFGSSGNSNNGMSFDSKTPTKPQQPEQKTEIANENNTNGKQKLKDKEYNANNQRIIELQKENKDMVEANASIQPQVETVNNTVNAHKGTLNTIKQSAAQVGEVVAQTIQAAEATQQEVKAQTEVLIQSEQSTLKDSKSWFNTDMNTLTNLSMQGVTGNSEYSLGTKGMMYPATAPLGIKLQTSGLGKINNTGINAPITKFNISKETGNVAKSSGNQAATKSTDATSQVTKDQVIEKGNNTNAEIDLLAGQIDSSLATADGYLTGTGSQNGSSNIMAGGNNEEEILMA